jgi:hypothetical protein
MTRPWREIVKHYSDYREDEASVRALGDLAARLSNSRYAGGLFGWTSLWTLCITQTEVSYPYDGPYLRLTPIRDGLIAFRYVDSADPKLQWHREVPADQAYDRLERFLLEDLKWFSSLRTTGAS